MYEELRHLKRCQYRTNDNLEPHNETTEMGWPHVMERRGGYHQEDANSACAGKIMGGGPRKDEHLGGHERIQDGRRNATKSKYVDHDDKAGPLQ